MRTIEKLSECTDKQLDPRTLSYRLKHPIRKKINALLEGKLSSTTQSKDEKKGQESDIIRLKDLIEREEESKNLLSYEDVSSLHQLLQRLDSTYNSFFYQFLDECRAFVPEERQNKELDQRLKKLQMESGLKSYQEMTRGVSNIGSESSSTSLSGVGQEIRNLKPTLIALINSLLVIGGTFVFVFKAVEYSLSTPDIVVQVFAGLIASIVVAIAEIYFLIKVI